MTRLLALFLLLLPSLAWADAGFIQAVPGTGRATCESITNPVTNQTWCADASGAATNTYTWKVWNGTTYIPITGGGGGGTPGLPPGAFQYNTGTAFGGSNVFYATAFGLSTSGTAAANTTAMNAAIAALVTAGGGTLLLPSGTFDLNTTTPITVSAVIQGLGTVLTLQSGQTGFTIGTTSPVSIRGIRINTGARAILVVRTTVFPITGVNQGTKTFTIAGDHTADFTVGPVRAFVRHSTGNDRTYTVVSRAVAAGNTNIVVSESIASATANGDIAPPSENGKFASITDNIFTGQSIAAVDWNAQSNQWEFRRNIVQDGAGVGLLINIGTDSCECVIDGNTIARMQGGAIRWTGGGDLRITNNKLFDFTHFAAPLIDLNNSGVPTSEVVIVGNALSGGNHTVHLRGSVVTQGIVITGNQINNSNAANIFSTSADISGVTISGNWFGVSAVPIDIMDGDQFTVIGNTFIAFVPSIPAINVAAAAARPYIGENNYSGFVPNIANLSGSLTLSSFTVLGFTELPTVARPGSQVTCVGCAPTTPCIAGAEVLTAYRNGAGQWACRPPDSVNGGGTFSQVSVWVSPSNVTGYAGFTFSPLSRLFSTDGSVTYTTPSNANIDTSLQGTANTTLAETPGRLEFALVGGSVGATIDATTTNVQSVGILGTNNAVMSGTNSAIIGSDGGSIGAGSLQSVVLGGMNGSVDVGLINAVSINGGVVTTNDTTVVAGTFSQQGDGNGQTSNIKSLTEETTILAAAFTDTAVQFPVGSTSLGCTVRVTTVIPTAATFDTGVSGATTRYATGTSTAAGSTGGAAVFSPYTSATSVRITPNAVPGAATGKVRVTCSFIDVTPPSS